MANEKASHLTWFDGNTYDIYDEGALHDMPSASDVGASPVISTSSSNNNYDVLFNVSGTPSYGNKSGKTLKFNPSTGNLYGSGFYISGNGDLAEDIVVPSELNVIPGLCYSFDGFNYYLTDRRNDKNYIGIHSDTAGYVLNSSNSPHIRVALAGFILAHVDHKYPSMTPLVCGTGGYLTKANIIDRLLGRVIAYYWKPEIHKTWHNTNVCGRHWIKIR